MNTENREYYCTFDPNSGRKTGGYIAGIQEVPVDAVRVSYTDFKLYARSSRYRYNWDTKKPLYINDTLLEIPIKELRERALELNDLITKRNITSGFLYSVRGTMVCFDSSMESQSTYQNNCITASVHPELTWTVRGVQQGLSEKSEFTLSGTEMAELLAACTKHIDDAKKAGWEEQSYIKDPTRTIEELQVYVAKQESAIKENS